MLQVFRGKPHSGGLVHHCLWLGREVLLEFNIRKSHCPVLTSWVAKTAFDCLFAFSAAQWFQIHMEKLMIFIWSTSNPYRIFSHLPARPWLSTLDSSLPSFVWTLTFHLNFLTFLFYYFNCSWTIWLISWKLQLFENDFHRGRFLSHWWHLSV